MMVMVGHACGRGGPLGDQRHIAVFAAGEPVAIFAHTLGTKRHAVIINRRQLPERVPAGDEKFAHLAAHSGRLQSRGSVGEIIG